MTLGRPFRALEFWFNIPRALPWAQVGMPLRGKLIISCGYFDPFHQRGK
jgi:hypothetical protein